MASSIQKYFPFELTPVVEEVIKKVEFSWNLSDNIIANLPGLSPFWIIRRESLDELLINQAIISGCQILNSFEVTNLQRNKDFWGLHLLMVVQK